jgi:hypothetical protein
LVGNIFGVKFNPREGYTLGIGKILGGVRIGQLRSKQRECIVHPTLSKNHQFECYGGSGGFGASTEDIEPFGNLVDHNKPSRSLGKFLYDGMTLSIKNGSMIAEPNTDPLESVQTARSKAFSVSKVSRPEIVDFPSPAFTISLSPVTTQDDAARLLQSIMGSNYIDKQTRAVVVDITVYNPMLDRVCFVRIITQLPAAGGVIPFSEFHVVRLWEFFSTDDYFYALLQFIIGLFYLFYFYELLTQYRKVGWAVLGNFMSVAQIANISMFLLSNVFKWYAESAFPAEIDVDSANYVDIGPSVRIKILATQIAAANTFLNFFKAIPIFSYSKMVKTVFLTLIRAAAGVSGFGVVFVVLLFGFAQAHCMVLRSSLFNFSTIAQSMFSLIRSLLGDFDFSELQTADYKMGPALFIIFVCLAVFVVLNSKMA